MRRNTEKRILQSCHADPTSGHFGMTKTWRRAAERFYWRGLSKQAKELVSLQTLVLERQILERKTLVLEEH